MDEQSTLIREIRKNTRETLRVSLDRFHAVDLLSARVWFENAAGEPRPGKAGWALRVEKLPELISALQDAEAEAKRRGLIGGAA